MNAPNRPRLWPSNQTEWDALAADLAAAERAEATAEAMARPWNLPEAEPMTPEEEETLF